MAKILILGGYGLTGRLLARHLLEETQAEIVLAGRSLEKAQRLAVDLSAEFGVGRLTATRLDASDRQSLEKALPGTDLLLVAAPTTQCTETVAVTALDCGVDYLDVQLGEQKIAVLKALGQEIERRGRCFVSEAGFHPGLPSAMVRLAAKHLDRLDGAITAGYLNMGRGLPYSEAVDELMQAFRDYNAQTYKNGQWTSKSSYQTRLVDFGAEIGQRKCFSMFFEELRTLPELYPTLHETGFYISSSHWIVDWVLTPLAMAGLKIAPQHGLRPMGKLVWWGMQNLPGPPFLVMLKVEASGERDGQPACFGASVSHPDGYELTAIPVVAFLLQYLDGSACQPGLWWMGHLAEPVRLFADMQRMGVRVTSRYL